MEKSALFFKKSALFRCFVMQNWSTTPVFGHSSWYENIVANMEWEIDLWIGFVIDVGSGVWVRLKETEVDWLFGIWSVSGENEIDYSRIRRTKG